MSEEDERRMLTMLDVVARGVEANGAAIAAVDTKTDGLRTEMHAGFDRG